MPTLKTIKAYNFSELPSAAQTRIMNGWRHVNIGHGEWWDTVYDDAKAVAKLFGIDIRQIYFSGFGSQGDGACFVGDWGYAEDCVARVKAHAPQDTTLHALAEQWHSLHASCKFLLVGSVYHRNGRYAHKHAVGFKAALLQDGQDAADSQIKLDDNWFSDEDMDLLREKYDENDPLEQPVALAMEVMRDFMEWIYRQLEAEHDYLTADETISQRLIEDEHLFTHDGRHIPASMLEHPATGKEGKQ